MSDRLRELLNPKRQRIDDENVAAILTYDVVHDGQARIRAALVREMMRECAKVMCKGCAKGLGMDGRYYHDDLGHHYECKAMPIHALLVETETKP